MTIRWRLTALYFVVLAAPFAIFVWTSDVGFSRSIEVTVNDSSSVNLRSLPRLFATTASRGRGTVQKELAELASWWPSGVLFEVADEKQSWIFRPAQFSQASDTLPAVRAGELAFSTTNLDHVQYGIASQRAEAGS